MIAADRGLVLRTFALGETSRIVSVLGFVRGRLRLVAHGARAPRSRFGASLEAGNELDLVYSLAPERDLGTLREAALERAHLAGAGTLEQLGVGLAALELLDRLVPEGAVEPGLAVGTTGMLAALRRSERRDGSLLLFCAFELRLLGWLGAGPGLESCAVCGGPAGGADMVLDIAAGALSCGTCQRAGVGRLALPATAARLLVDLGRLTWDEVGSRDSTAPDRRHVGVALHRLLASHVDRYRAPRALSLLKKVDAGSLDAPRDEPPTAFRSIA